MFLKLATVLAILGLLLGLLLSLIQQVFFHRPLLRLKYAVDLQAPGLGRDPFLQCSTHYLLGGFLS